MTDNSSTLSYKDAGVDIAAGQQLVTKIKEVTKSTYTSNILSSLGGFFSLCKIPPGFKEPILVATTDGVGTKLCLAQQQKQHNTIGIDLVAMCVNDLIVGGAQPLFFLDYFATSKLNPCMASEIIAGIAEGCKLSKCSLTGGETAEMPGLYHNNDYDLAGFCVGVVEREQIIDGSKVATGDKLIAVASSGCHSNGYSLVRKIIQMHQVNLTQDCEGKSLSSLLLEPTRIYVDSILKLIKMVDVHAMAHITGGGLQENIPRVLPKQVSAVIDKSSWQWPPIFQWLQETGNVTTSEMFSTFNLGVGMVLCVAANDVTKTLEQLAKTGETAWVIGEVKTGSEPIVF
jgi:phosphoribosylformylglycinamidine cyclo-ligase